MVHAKLAGSVSTQSHTKQGYNVIRDYSLDVRVKASQAELPGGMARVLDLLEAAISEAVKPLPKHEDDFAGLDDQDEDESQGSPKRGSTLGDDSA
jgi:hypothetical protein